MSLYSGQTYWDKTIEVKEHFPKLNKDKKTETLIIGGGMSGI